MKELNIQIPEGYEIDKDKSTFEKIVFKKKEEEPISWGRLESIAGWYVEDCSAVVRSGSNPIADSVNMNIFKEKEQAEATIALAKLSHLIPAYIKRYYSENPDWKPDWNKSSPKYAIFPRSNVLIADFVVYYQRLCVFPTWEIAKRFFEEQKELLEQAKPFL